MKKAIKTKERNAIIQSLKSGVVPRVGLQHIQVGRNGEIKSFINDLDTIVDGGNAFRFVIGEYGSGKTFFIQLVRSMALEKKLVTIHADLSPTKRLHGSNGKARMLYTELMSNVATRNKQDGNALSNVLEKFITIARDEAERKRKSVSDVINLLLGEVRDSNGGYDFAKVISKYWEGYDTSNDVLKNNAMRWMKGEYTTRTEAKKDLDVRSIINDASFYDSLKLFAVLVRKAGYSGLLICLDEMVNLYKITNSPSRKANYEEILRMLNDTLQGTVSNIGFIMGGTPEFLTDGNRGLYSYEALKSRLSENSFANKLGVVDYNSTVLRLANLSQEELYVLLKHLRNVYACGKEKDYLVPDEALVAYLKHCSDKIGDSYFRTPRNTIKDFLNLLSTLEQYPQFKWTDLINKIEVEKDFEKTELSNLVSGSESVPNSTDIDEFDSFKL